MKISVAICTWNRAELLERTLQSLCEMRSGDDSEAKYDWELIVVNNNSTDHTVEVAKSFETRLPLKLVREPLQGHSHSRNRAIENCSGEYIVWTDNDVLVDPEWLNSYHRSFVENPDVVFFGGEIAPEFLADQPKWLCDTWDMCKSVYATRLLGNEPIELNAERLPYGANFAIRTDIQKQNLFDTRFGRKGQGMVGDDETAMLRSVVADGGRGRWVPGAKLKHLIPADRMTEKYVRGYFYGQGVTNTSTRKLTKGRIGCLWEAIWHGAMYRIKSHRTRPQEWVSHMIRSSLSWGELKGM